MNETVISTILILTGIGVLAAIILYLVSKRFYVKEDPRIAVVEEALPATNCGGCGQPGCHSFAEALVQATDLSELHCPVGGNEVMKQVADILGLEAVEKDPYIAVVRCSGSFEHRKKTSIYDGSASCTIAAELYSGDTGCAYGCLGLGECEDVCDFDAIHINPITGLPVVNEDKCTACNACITACPKDIIELWPVGRKSQRIYVACINEDKGGTARKSCSVACSGCSKCMEECGYDAISITNNLATIDFDKCKLCAKCVGVCDAQSIIADNIPVARLDKLEAKRQKEAQKKKMEAQKAKEEAKANKA